ncbi:hypothetical protein RRU94_16205 [Domibacillus sp. DTU_2020_1001157_1_SI_ALB_TIR_016]|uniref:hypothetical protein n=1 Tax=Domibacillus sp. DTU_2020_1001157_1_SI_ALB_TIR_016 TaxID=3077789 RepID=UPI0028F10491|nr:hypothetical protein [Domibacillus sp. DTU_2020_1001157_1_SI_ALB_TIR_016]WNS82278.1 hypothetical protein RRU94_16205 [Domibacillus sp. DTU_2020_1001157_1_SI_ALB_TIR_016]
MQQKLAYLLISLTALLLIGCSDKEPKKFNLDQLTRVDIQEITPKSENEFVLMEEKDLNIIREAFKEVEWEPNTMVDIQGERTVEATFFYTYEENMPERLFVYEVYLMKNGSISLQSEKGEEGYGELSKEHAESLKTLFFRNK